jgi:uncharacterized protein YcaQ
MVLPMADLPLYLADMTVWQLRETEVREWLEINGAFRQRVLQQLRATGPLLSREIPDSCEVPWGSTGWTNNRNVTQMLELLALCGEIAVAGRRGRQRVWDLAERVYPTDVPIVPSDDARRIRHERRLRAFGVARPKVVGDAGTSVEIEGTSGLWRVDPNASAEGFAGRTALLSPFDRLIHDRVRAVELFNFEYSLEMYKAKVSRRWGYYALPILHHDRLIGKVDATADRQRGRLIVKAIHEDLPFTKRLKGAVFEEVFALASWLGLEDVCLD